MQSLLLAEVHFSKASPAATLLLMFIFMQLFSPWQTPSKLGLRIWLNEKVHFMQLFSPWQTSSKLGLRIWLIEKVHFMQLFSPWQTSSKLGLLIWLIEKVGFTIFGKK